jgi:hypothetical protein
MVMKGIEAWRWMEFYGNIPAFTRRSKGKA